MTASFDIFTRDRTFVVAEIGANHEGDFELARQMVRDAAAAGADAVKFQTYRAEKMIAVTEEERRRSFRAKELSDEQFRALSQESRRAGVIFFSTPFDVESADMLDPIVPFFKIASGDLTAVPLIRHVAKKGKPLILSTGMGTPEEIAAALGAIAEADPATPLERKAVLLHCISSYPTPPEQANLRSILYLRERFGLQVGYSDHTIGTLACEVAVALGARVIEKHFTYRKENQTFRDHALSADPRDLRLLVERIRQIERMLGEHGKQVQPCEADNIRIMRRSVAAREDLRLGELIQAHQLTILRPADGIPPSALEEVVGKKAIRAIKAGEVLRFQDIA